MSRGGGGTTDGFHSRWRNANREISQKISVAESSLSNRATGISNNGKNPPALASPNWFRYAWECSEAAWACPKCT